MLTPCTLCSASTASRSRNSSQLLFSGILTSVGCGRSTVSSTENRRSRFSGLSVNGSPARVLGQETLISTMALRPAARSSEMR